MGSGDVERDVNAALLEVARHVLPEIGQLECGARSVGHRLAFFVTIATKIKDQTPDGIRGIDAIADHGIPRRIALDVLILAEGSQQIGKGLLGNVFCNYRFAKRDENGMGWAAIVAIVEFQLPPIE